MAKQDFDGLVAKVVQEWSRGDVSASATAIAIGKAAHAAVRCRLRAIYDDPAGRRAARAESVQTMCDQIEAAGHRAGIANLNRCIAIYNVSLIYGPKEAKKLPLELLKAFATTIRRNAAKEEWGLKSSIESAGPALWSRTIAGELPTTEAVQAIAKLVNPNPKPKKPAKPRLVPVKKVIEYISAWPLDQQKTFYKALGRQLKAAAEQPPPQPKPAPIADEPPRTTVPIPDEPPGLVAPTRPIAPRAA